MTLGLTVMLAGAFGVPIALLWAGHRLRRRSPRWRAVFFGALAGHVLAMPIALAAAMIPPAEWARTDVVRGALGYWLLLLAPAAGAMIGVWRSPRGRVRPSAGARDRRRRGGRRGSR